MPRGLILAVFAAPSTGKMDKVTIRKGETLVLDAVYQQDERPHFGAMAYLVVAGSRRSDLDIVDRDSRI